VASSHNPLISRYTGGVLTLTGVIFVAGTAFDFFTLWVLQRSPGAQWEFVATTQTLEGLPRIILGLCLILASLDLSGTASVAKYRVSALVILAFGFIAIGLGAMLGLSYAPIAGVVEGDALTAVKSTAVKSVGLTLIYVLALIPLGIMGFRARNLR